MFSWTRLYVDCPLKENETLVLPDTQSRHLIQVLRQKEGAPLILFNGDGQDYHATIVQISKKSTLVRIDHRELIERESALKIHLGQCLARGERMDFVIQKCVELGVSEITPLFSDYVQVKLPKERLKGRLQHWQKIIIHACEQSGRNKLPVLHPPVHLKDWIQSTKETRKIVLHFPGTNALTQQQRGVDSVALLVGPEGGLSHEEAQAAQANGFELVQLGPRVMRAETAGMAAVMLAQTLWGDFKSDSETKTC